MKSKNNSCGQAIIKNQSGNDVDPYDISAVEDLLYGQTEWRNISDIIMTTFKALTDVVKAQGKKIRDLEKALLNNTNDSNPAPFKSTNQDELSIHKKRSSEQLQNNQNPSHKISSQSNNKNAALVDKNEKLDQLTLNFDDGITYNGQGWAPRTRHGYGVLIDAEQKEIYRGQWRNNQFYGEGKLTNQQQEVQMGTLDWNNMSTIDNGWAVYEGEFNHGMMNGHGVMTLTNGERYTGGFKSGMVHGQGEFFDFYKNTVKGIWENNFFVQLQL